MLFNSIEFAFFLPIVFIIYWLVRDKKIRLQNLLLVLASYVFYGWWDWKFLSLIVFSSCVDFLVGKALSSSRSENNRKLLLLTSIFVNLGFLGFFKYFNFFAESFSDAFTFFGSPIEVDRLSIVLPVGISFYTFQTLSYSIDIYRRKLEPATDLISFLAYVSFFPQLVAGPIERATNLLPQFYKKRNFDSEAAVDGLRQILWGLFKKVVIADNCARLANHIFEHHSELSGSTLLLGAVFFAFQIYGDFSGYSDMAIGIARLFGFNLKQNFNFPYFSRDIAEFWRRWHISLNTWFRDYLYIPLGGSRGSVWLKVRNIFIIFIVSGFWHGANWTFIAWGFLNACYFLPIMLFNRNRNNLDTVAEGKVMPSIREFFAMGYTFCLTTLAWIFFRAESVSHAISYIDGIISPSLFQINRADLAGVGMSQITLVLLILTFLIVEWIGRSQLFAIQNIGAIGWRWRYLVYYAVLFSLFFFGGEEQQFIYFQF